MESQKPVEKKQAVKQPTQHSQVVQLTEPALVIPIPELLKTCVKVF